jgi:energy-coupling factor transporter ATP-binding protein EcfA2
VRIERVRIRGYRCLKELTLNVDDYTALVGPNGSGKSSVLYALNWFFNGGTLTEEDLHSSDGANDSEEQADADIDVEVTFSNLTAEDRQLLGQYGRGERATFRRVWTLGGNEKMIGNARQGPGFAAIRAAKLIGDMRAQYQQGRSLFPSLPDVSKREDIVAQLEAWEGDLGNAPFLVDVGETEAPHMFGFNGEHTLARRMRFVLVPASSVMSDQVSTSGKASAVSKLIGSLMSEAVTAARTKWLAENKDELTRLGDEIESGVRESTKQQTERVNRLLIDLVPAAQIEFVPEIPSWSVKGDPSIKTDVVIDGERRDVERQGHGIQRAVMISLLQALVPSAPPGAAPEPEGATGDQAATASPALVICIEEPETYQHPVRARHFARVLEQWSKLGNSQVLFATHSPYFILPAQFASLRRFALDHGSTEVKSTTVEAVAAAADVVTAKVQRVVEKELPRPFSEGFFADAVVFVEGDTDRVVFEELSERLGSSLDARGIAVLAMGSKENLKVPFTLLNLVGIPVYVIADGDADGAARGHPDDASKRADAAASNKLATDGLVAWLPQCESVRRGALPYSWGAPTTITDRWCVLRDDLEAELEAWPEFMAELNAEGHQLRSKNIAAARSAACNAGLEGLPDNLRELIQALADFGH